jgi:hypothetical protein
LAICILPFIVAEITLDIVFPDKVARNKRIKTDELAYQFNEDYLVALKPDVSRYFERSIANGSKIIHWSTNDNSFRGPALMNDPGTRIIVYGDSNIQAQFSDYEKTFTYELEQYLKSDGLNDVEAINAGVVGFGPDQSLIRFEKEADIYRPNLVIFHICTDNDFGDVLRDRLLEIDTHGNLVKTNFKRTVDKCLKTNYIYTLKNFMSSLMIVRAINKVIRSIHGEEENSRIEVRERVLAGKTLQILRNVPADKIENISEDELKSIVVDELQKRADEEYLVYKESRPQKFSHCDDHYDIDLAIDPDKDSSKTKIMLMDSILKEAKDVADSKGIKFLVVIQPSVIDMTVANDDVLSYQYLQKFPNYKRTNLTDTIATICARYNIEYINLFDVFAGYDTSKLYFRKDDNHWNDQGQDVAAKATASYIISHIIAK